jgi:hypothetical protein
MKKLTLILLILFTPLITTLSAAPISLFPDSVWTRFSWDQGLGSITDPLDGFNLSLVNTSGVLSVVDSYTAGDMFRVNIINSDTLANIGSFDTSFVAPNSMVWVGSADEAWADPVHFSQLRVGLDPGNYTVTLSVIQRAVDLSGQPFDLGAGFIEASSPEPSSLLLSGIALILVFLGTRRRRRAIG